LILLGQFVVKEKWGQFVTVTKHVSPSVALGGSLVGAPTVGVAMKELAENAEKMSSEREKDRSGALAKDWDYAGTPGLSTWRAAICQQA
jgi:hypothetical protein